MDVEAVKARGHPHDLVLDLAAPLRLLERGWTVAGRLGRRFRGRLANHWHPIPKIWSFRLETLGKPWENHGLMGFFMGFDGQLPSGKLT